MVGSAQLEEEEEEEHRACKNVEDAVPDHLGRDGDDVTALGAAPGDGVEEKEEGQVERREAVAGPDRSTDSDGRAGPVPKQGVPVGEYIS